MGIVQAVLSVSESIQTVDHSARTIAAANDMQATVRDIESGQRGYLLTGDAIYLRAYERSLGRLDVRMERLGGLLSADPARQAQMDRIRGLVAKKLRFAQSTVELKRQGKAAQALEVVRSGAGERAMEAVETEIQALRSRELQLNEQARQNTSAKGRGAIRIVLLAAVAILLSGAAAAFGLLRSRARMDEETAAGDRRFQATFDEAGVGLALVGLDGRWLHVNRQLSIISGYSQEELLDATCPENLHDDLIATDRLVSRSTDYVIGEKQFTRKDGTILWVNTRGRLIQDADGKPDFLFGVVEDISERKRINASLIESEARYRAVFDSALEVIAVIDAKGEIQSINPAVERIFGYAPEELEGQNVRLLVPVELVREHKRYRENGKRGLIGGHREVVGRRRDGGSVSIDLSVAKWERDGQTFFTGIMRDVTPRRAAEAALRTSEERLRSLQAEYAHLARVNELGEMAAAIAHEINQPLTAIVNYLNTGLFAMADGFGQEAFGEAEEVMSQASQQALRAGEIVQRLREFIRKDTGERRVEAVETLVDVASRLALIDAAANGISVERIAGAEGTQVRVDPVQIQQVIVNLVRNAIDAMVTLPPYENRRLTITTRELERGNAVEIVVADTGPGIAPGMREKIFEPFVTSKANGMGIGLSVCRRLIDAHDGSIELEDETGQGAAFRICLPRYSAN